MKQLLEPESQYYIYITSDQTNYWGQENFYENYDRALTRYNELLKLTDELGSEFYGIEQQIHLVKVITKYEDIRLDVRIIGQVNSNGENND